MAVELKHLDIADMPDLVALAERVQNTNELFVLSRDGEDLAILMPVALANGVRFGRAKTRADYEAFLASAGSWSDVDTERLVNDIYERRGRPADPSAER